MEKKKWTIVAYPEEGLPRREATVVAETHELAIWQGFNIFPEYHEIGAYEKDEPCGNAQK